MPIAQLILYLALAYVVFGGLVCAEFLLFSIEKVEPAAVHALAFRVLLVPGVVLLWPLVLWRRRQLTRQAAP